MSTIIRHTVFILTVVLWLCHGVNVQELRQEQLNKKCEICVEKRKRRELLRELSYKKLENSRRWRELRQAQLDKKYEVFERKYDVRKKRTEFFYRLLCVLSQDGGDPVRLQPHHATTVSFATTVSTGLMPVLSFACDPLQKGCDGE